jgi:hypothetical protein
VLAIDNVESSLRVADIVRTNFPDLAIYARARDRTHVHKLMDLGVSIIERETFLSALALTKTLLRGLGLREAEVKRLIETFKRQDERRLYGLPVLHGPGEGSRHTRDRAKDRSCSPRYQLPDEEGAKPERAAERVSAETQDGR